MTEYYLHSAKATPCSVCAFHAIDIAPRLALDAHLLVSNDPPAFTDASTLKSDLLNLRRTLSQITCNISQAEDEVARMKTQRDDIHSAIRNIETVLHPVRSLPQDILAAIFRSGIPQVPLPEYPDVEDEDYDSIGPLNPLWALSSVCRRWRNITLSSPRIWSFISLVMDNYEEKPLDSLLFRLGLQIQRSGNVELDVELCDANNYSDPDVIVLQEKCVLPLLHTTTRRWSSFKSTCYKPVLDSFIGCSFERLTHLGISLRKPKDVGDAVTCFRHAPHIQYVDTNYGDIELLWRGVASYNCDVPGLMNIPKMASSLHELTIFGGMNTGRPAPSLVLPTLTRLTLHAFSHSGTLETPALRTLCLDFGFYGPLAFPGFRRPPTCLKNISVITALPEGIRIAELIAFLGGTAHATALFLHSGAVTDEVLVALHLVDEPEQSPPLLPELESLRLTSKTIMEHCDRVITLVDSRPAIEELQVIGDLDNDWPEDERDFEGAERWRDFCARMRVIHVLDNAF